MFNKIRALKITMNSLRTNFILPDNHKILITPYWLLGFVEGDGSFSVSTQDSFPLRFNISQVIYEKNLLEAIKLFFLEEVEKNAPDLPTARKNFKLKRKNSNIIQIIETPWREKDLNLLQEDPCLRTRTTVATGKTLNRSLKLNFNINDHSFLINILVPFFNKLIFFTKKELDYIDWKSILELKTRGWHLSKEGADLIRAISKNMNNNRLSTNSSVEVLSQPSPSAHRALEEIKAQCTEMLNRPSNLEIYPDGKIYIKSEQKF